MKPRQRQAAILEYLQKQGKCSVEELAQYFDTTGTTIRKDLVILEHAGTVIRTYGGVVLNKEESDFKLAMEIIKKDYEDKFKSELSQMKTKKEKDEFIGLLLDSNEDYAKKKEAIEDIRFTEEAFKIESENLERVKKTLEEFIMLLKKEV